MDEASRTIGTAIREAAKLLDPYSDTPRLDAELLLAHTLHKQRGFLHSRGEIPLDSVQYRHFLDMIGLRKAGRPIAYLLGEREFWSLPLKVTPDTLIPRPETELLVELALARIPSDVPRRILDLGTGSGAIACAIARERPASRITAIDSHDTSMAVARENAQRLGLRHIDFIHSDWFSGLRGHDFDLVVSNPPYIAIGDPHLTTGDLRAEPRAALVAGPTGLEAITKIIDQARSHLTNDGWLLLEHGYEQQDEALRLLATFGYRDIEGYRDLYGQPRAVSGRWSHPDAPHESGAHRRRVRR